MGNKYLLNTSLLVEQGQIWKLERDKAATAPCPQVQLVARQSTCSLGSTSTCTNASALYIYMYTYNGLHRERRTEHSDSTGSNGLILLPSLRSRMLVEICICAYILCGCSQSWAHIPSLPRCWQQDTSLWGHSPALAAGTNALTHSHRHKMLSGTPQSPVATPHPMPCGLTFRDLLTLWLPDRFTYSLAHLAWSFSGAYSYLHTHTCSSSRHHGPMGPWDPRSPSSCTEVSASCWCHRPMNPWYGCSHTTRHTHTQDSPSSRKRVERNLMRRQDRLCWSGTGHGQRGVTTSKSLTRNYPFFPHYFSALLPP